MIALFVNAYRRLETILTVLALFKFLFTPMDFSYSCLTKYLPVQAERTKERYKQVTTLSDFSSNLGINVLEVDCG